MQFPIIACAIIGQAFMASAAAISNNTAEALQFAARDDFTGVGCDNIGLSQSDTDAATSALAVNCNGMQSIFKYSGDTVAFYCEWHDGPECSASSLGSAINMITSQCGNYGAGSYSDGTESTRTYSYGYTNWRQMSYCNVPAGTQITS